jgi:hypothetical protein
MTITKRHTLQELYEMGYQPVVILQVLLMDEQYLMVEVVPADKL